MSNLGLMVVRNHWLKHPESDHIRQMAWLGDDVALIYGQDGGLVLLFWTRDIISMLPRNFIWLVGAAV
jgi:hypothetical protein